MFGIASHTFLYIFFYSVSIVAIFLIVLLVIARQKTAVYRSFAVFGLLVNGWLALQFLSQLLHDTPSSALILLRAATVASVYMGGAFAVFTRLYVEKSVRKSAYVGGAIVLLVVTGMGLSPWNITSAKISSEGIAIESVGALYPVVFGLTSVAFIYGLTLLFRYAMRHGQDRAVKKQTLVLFMSVGQALLINIVFGNASSEVLLTQLFVPTTCLLMIGLIAYAIIRHKLFDVRILAVRTLAYTITLAIIGILYVTPAVLLTASLSEVRLGVPTLVLLTLITFVVAFLFQPLRNYFNKATNRLFFRDYYNPQDVLDSLGDLLVGTVDVEEIKNQSSTILTSALKPQSFSYLLTSDKNHKNSRFLHLLLRSKLSLVVTDELQGGGYESLREELRAQDVAIAIRLQTKHEDLGFILLGFRQSGGDYTSDDRRLLTVIAGEVAISLQNALRFQEIREFNATLQQKIDEATKKLRRTNERLRVLDQTKDDFISMASHQLRTPLTSVKGYVSMVLDGDGGKINETQRKLLTQSFLSSQRMVYLISDLLNVSRLKTGKFIIEPIESNLANVIEEEVEQLVETVKSRGLELSYHKPEHFPMLMLDETKIRQVIMNFIDNAIYYTPSGGHINVYLADKPDSIEFTVVDDGIGVPKHEQHHLFSKFYRAKNAKSARPDGTGLGIFMAKKVIVAQGGAIIFKSTEGKGSTFGFTFPKSRLVLKHDQQPKQAVHA